MDTFHITDAFIEINENSARKAQLFQNCLFASDLPEQPWGASGSINMNYYVVTEGTQPVNEGV